MERKQVEELILMMQAAYPRMFDLSNELGKSQLRLWRDFLLQWDYEATKKRLDEYILDSPYPPKISDIKPHTQVKYSIKDQLEEIYGERID